MFGEASIIFAEKFDEYLYNFDKIIIEVRKSTDREFIDSMLIKLEHSIFVTSKFVLSNHQTQRLEKAIWDLTVLKADVYLNNIAFLKDFAF